MKVAQLQDFFSINSYQTSWLQLSIGRKKRFDGKKANIAPRKKEYLYLLLSAVLYLVGPSVLFAQKENSVWYFGNAAGIDFSSGKPIAIYDSKMFTSEGCASVSDASGKLLFYTNGVKVFNKTHKIMDNGNGLNGHNSSTQSAVILKKPGSTSLYYILNPGCYETPNSFHYSVIDMTQNNGLGKVIEKNTQLLTKATSEKVVAIKDINGTGFWIVTHTLGSNEFYSFHLTSAGVNFTPVVSSTGSYIPPSPSKLCTGYLKASPDGSKIASCSGADHKTDENSLELFDFNISTGVVSNGFTLHQGKEKTWYGCSFSPNGKILYAGMYHDSATGLYQYDVSLPSSLAIAASGKQIYASPINLSYTGAIAALQMAPDGKIYIARYRQKFLSAINKPNILGTGCDVVENAIVFTQPLVEGILGLPNNIDYQLPNGPVPTLGNDTFLCPPSSSGFIIRLIEFDGSFSGNGYFSLTKWSDGTVGSSLKVYSSGTYWADIPTPNGFIRDSIKVIFYPDLTKYDFLGNDTLLCGKAATYTATYAPHTKYKWSTGATSQSTIIPQSGTYWVDAETPCGKVRDSIKITLMDSIPPIDLGPDTVVCGTNITLRVNNIPGAVYEWSTGEKTQTITVSKVGNYWVAVSNQCNRKQDFINVDFVQDQIDKVFIGNDTLLCAADALLLDPGYIPNAKYKWGTGDTTQTYRVNSTGKYTLVVTTYGCNTQLKDAIDVVVFKTQTPDLPKDSNWCEHNFKPLTLSPKGEFSRFLWQDGSTTPTFTAAFPGIYTLETKDTCGNEYKDTFTLAIEDCPCELHVPNVFTPNNDGKNDIFSVYDYCHFKRFNLKIFNRWGQLVFESGDPYAGWDGNSAGKPAPEGVYMVHVAYDVDNMPTSPDYSGTVTLLR